MKILGIEKMSLVDYPGQVCAVLFTGGCNFRCPFCHNSGIVNKEYNEIGEAEIFEFLNKRKGMLDAVCVSGGEPTLQSDLFEFIQKLKTMGFKVKLDTNGTNPEILKKLIDCKLLDYVAMDIKNNIDDYYPIIGGVKIDTLKIKESINILKLGLLDYEFRTTLVKEYHKEENIKQLAEELNGARRLYLQKYVDSDGCITRGLNEISVQTAEHYKDILSKTIKDVKLRGY